jgi:hypothetical protein
MPAHKIPLALRLMDGVSIQTNGCWVWYKNRHTRRFGEYGKLKVNKRTLLAHRVSYEHFVGPIPSGRMVLHGCDNPRCINPKHLALGTNSDNQRSRFRRTRRFQRAVNGAFAKLTGETGCAMLRGTKEET